MSEDYLKKVERYYNAKIHKFGASPKGVDWNSSDSQLVRFSILEKIIEVTQSFSVADFGCGYGAMYEYLSGNYCHYQYHGYDIAGEMIAAAKSRYCKELNASWHQSSVLEHKAFDYVIASGIFNVKLENSDDSWLSYLIKTITMMNEASINGFAFNCLTCYSDREFMRNDLYYANPLELFDYCKRSFSRNVSLLHDYNLYEFTILVRKNA